MTSRSYSSKFFGFISEVLHNYNDSTIINSYEFIISKLISIAQKWLPISIRANLVLWSSFILILILQVIGYGMTLILGGILWVNNLISVGTIYLLYNYTKNIFEPISNIQNQMKILQLLSASFQKNR